ncbi:MAG TPA: alkaline phosphatase family protein [Candidatus Thermoplasmatota archaeon]|nr:alkaline phosphatase family protein [Candidatus Thermoplasmatota archaeon]
MRVAVIGLDGMPPRLLEELAPAMPNLTRLARGGLALPMRSTDPPITVPAWSVMMSGRNPGALGFTGFRNLRRGTYDDQYVANATHVAEPRLWDLFGEANRKVVVHGVPQTWPARKVNGVMTTCLLTPDCAPFAYPPSVEDEVREVVGGDYPFDVSGFRSRDRAELLDALHVMLDRHFDVAERLATTREWDLFAMVEIGTDRVHHGFWRHHDPAHRLHEPDSPFRTAIADYYAHVDRRLGDFLAKLDNDTAVLVVSDHGARAMDGAINLNDWLVSEGLLALKRAPSGVERFSPASVDWSRTKAWALGGYYARVFVNLKGREPEGCVRPGEYEAFRDDLASRLAALAPGTRVLKPEDVYRGPATKEAPDLLVYLGNLRYRAHESVGHASLVSETAEVGTDDANHDAWGVCILHAGRAGPRLVAPPAADILDVAPTVLDLAGLPKPASLEGVSLV